MIPAVIVAVYLCIVLYIGIFAFRKGTGSRDDFFVANRSLGPYVFLLAIFGTNMTAFAILGSSGLAYQRGIGVYGLMASASGLVIPLCLFFIGTRLWALGKQFGHVTQVQYFRDRWECSHIGTVIFALTAGMLVPYIIIGVMGGGHTLEALTTVMGPDGKPILHEVTRDGKTLMETKHWISYEFGGAIVAIVVMSYVFFGGMRGTAWVNMFQTLLFLGFGAIAFVLISKNLGGFDRIMGELASNPKTAPLLTRERIPMEEFFSYTLIPLSAIMFPHIAIMCMTAEKVTSFKKTVVFYPICIALIWLPCVVLGVVAAHQFPGLKAGESDDVILRLLTLNTDAVLAGVLGAAIMACVMASDSQILALCTMFSQDIFAHYGGKERFGDKAQVWTGRIFVILVTALAYLVGLRLEDKAGIFELAIRFAFSGFAALAPIMLAALFWKRSTKWGALAAAIWVIFAMSGTWWLYDNTAALAPKPGQPMHEIFPMLGRMFLRSPSNVLVYGYLPVLPMVLGSAFFMVIGSLLTRPPSRKILEKYFPPNRAN
ncbi:MAG: sodium:solute symporter family protein [Verrucomicrobiales bacterium]|nr:sodium:solute symporter family protein [Verrucomicrobiales bacterium]